MSTVRASVFRMAFTLLGVAACMVAAAPHSTTVEPNLDKERELSREAAVVPDSLEFVATNGSPGLTCETIGGFDASFPTLNRLSGNIYEVHTVGQLRNYMMELNFRGEMDLYFVVLHRQTNPDDPELFTEIPSFPLMVQNNVVGTGVGMYGPGEFDLPLLMKPGFDYFLGVAWGDEVSLAASRDNAGRRDFSHGVVKGLGSEPLSILGSELPPEIPLEGIDITLAMFGAFITELCFEPEPGACCCVGESGCLSILHEQCTSLGGFFQGEREVCSEDRCECGVCCTPCGECENDYTQSACTSQFDGEWLGVEVTTCSETICADSVKTGACCKQSGCTELCEVDCTSSGVRGTYLGDGTVCDPNPCAGACCVTTDPELNQTIRCENRTQAQCNSFTDADFKGLSTSCQTLPMELECGGACCWDGDPPTRCDPVADRSLCLDESLGGLRNDARYLGDGTLCPEDCRTECDPGDMSCVPLPSRFNTYGACCLADGLCLFTTPQFCNASWVGGVYIGDDVLCDFDTCFGLDVGACCFHDGFCQLDTKPDCVAWGGVFQGYGSSCEDDTCVVPTGACCVADGACQTTTLANCQAECLPSEVNCMEGVFLGEGSTCSPAFCEVPKGACCIDDDEGTCDQLTQADCMALSGAWHEGLSCLGMTCSAAPTGACCFAELGTCQEGVGKLECEAQTGGTWKGTGTICADSCAFGACCEIAESSTVGCRSKLESECADADTQVFQGEESTCEPAGCSNAGTCCFSPDAQDAVFLFEERCEDRGGAFIGNSSPGQCDTQSGACCVPGEGCQMLSAGACAGSGGSFLGVGAICFGTPCEAVGACCMTDGSCLINETQDDCLAGGGTYQDDNSICEPGLCPQPTRACCMPGVGCEVRDEADCTTAGGTFMGNATTCTPDDPCPRACCNALTGCTDRSAADCSASDGVPQLPGTSCSTPGFACPIQTGACCNHGMCMNSFAEAACVNSGGIYQGNSSMCDAENQCNDLFIESSFPPLNAIDARQPSPVNDATDLFGWDSVELTFNGDGSAITASDFLIETFASDSFPIPAPPPGIVSVGPLANVVTLGLDGPIPAGHWTRITHIASGSRTCLGYLPGDVDHTSASNALDILRVIDCLNGTRQCTLYQGDVDRSGESNAQDILGVINLLNGAGEFESWFNKPLPSSPCLGACCNESVCTNETPEACALGDGVSQGLETSCSDVPDPCP